LQLDGDLFVHSGAWWVPMPRLVLDVSEQAGRDLVLIAEAERRLTRTQAALLLEQAISTRCRRLFRRQDNPSPAGSAEGSGPVTAETSA
jgi:hypothetical protein